MTLILILTGIAALAGYVAYLAHFINNDGRGSRAASGLPRSHRPDVFEVRSFR